MSPVIMPSSGHQVKNEPGQNVYNELISGVVKHAHSDK